MADYVIKYSPEFLKVARGAAELDEERTKLQTVLEPEIFERVRQIVEAQDRRKRAAYYGTIFEAVCAGEDFSRVESIRDIADIFARFIIGQAFGTA